MKVSTNKGDVTCTSKNEILEIMKQGAALEKGDEIWISGDNEEYPCLNLLVKSKYACAQNKRMNEKVPFSVLLFGKFVNCI